MPATEGKELKRRAALAALEYERVLEAIANLCATDYGRVRVLRLYPPFVADPVWPARIGRSETIEDEFDRIEALTGAVQRDEELPFRGVRDLGDSLERASVPGSRLEPHELLDVAQLLTASARLRGWIEKWREQFEALQPFATVLPAVPELVSVIEKTISVGTGEVVDNASPELKHLRRAIEAGVSAMRTKLDALVRKFSEENILLESGYSVRDDRFVLAVKSLGRNRVHGIVHDLSASGNTVFIEPDELVAAGNEIRHLSEEEAEEVRRILRELTGRIREYLPELKDAVLAVGLLDSLQARARFAVQVGATRPVLRGGMLRLVEVRHPLLVLRKGMDGTVPLTLYLGRDPDQIQDSRSSPETLGSDPVRSAASAELLGRSFVVTGPNAGGKTVLLKTVGLATAMVHAGLWPPCGDGTIIPPIDEWHVIIGDEQSLEGDLSSFTGHLEKLKTITQSPAPNKLVLIDEIAAGTDPGEGGPLAEAFLEMSVERGWWTLVTTHMGELKAFAHQTDGVRNGSMQFNRDTLSPTYVFQPDLPGSSYALEIASRVGLPKKLVKRARDLSGEKRRSLEDLIEEFAQRLRGARERERELENALRNASERDQKLRGKLEQIEQTRDEAVAKAAAEAKRILDEANRTIERSVKEIRERQASKESILAAKQRFAELQQKVEGESRRIEMREKQRRRRQTPSVSMEPAAPREPGPVTLGGPVEVGDEVVIGDGGTHGVVLALKKNSAQVAAGSVKLWLAITQLRRIGPSVPTARIHVDPGVGGGADRGPVSTELMLIGKRAKEAETELENYLEQLALANLPFARIVHGKGTGALRAMVQQVLKNHPLVAEYRFGEPGEGGDGVTIVNLAKT